MIENLLNRTKTSLSFEVSPPKTEEEFQEVFGKLDAFAALKPDFISCTYGAGGSRAGKTVEIVSYIQNQLHIDAIAHMTCVGFKQADLQTNCEALQKEGIRYVMALRGDRPRAMTDEQYDNREFFYASDMVRYLKANTSLQVAGACYPEKHYEAESFESDLEHLKEKVDAGAAFLITQLFFSNDVFYRFKERVDAAGITVLILTLRRHHAGHKRQTDRDERYLIRLFRSKGALRSHRQLRGKQRGHAQSRYRLCGPPDPRPERTRCRRHSSVYDELAEDDGGDRFTDLKISIQKKGAKIGINR